MLFRKTRYIYPIVYILLTFFYGICIHEKHRNRITQFRCIGFYLASLEDRYLRTIRATLKMMAWSNWRRSSPVSFLIFSRR